MLRRDPRIAADARRRRDPADPVRQAGRRVPHARRRAARADRQLQPRAALGDVGALQRARSQGPDDVRPDDRRLVDLHRLAGHRAGHLRNLRRDGPPALRRRPRRASGSSPRASAAWAARSRWPPRSPARAVLNIECQQSRIDMRLRTRYVDEQASDLDDALARIAEYTAAGQARLDRAARQRRRDPARTRAPRRARPTPSPTRPARTTRCNGYLPIGWTVEQLARRAEPIRDTTLRDAAKKSMRVHVEAMLAFQADGRADVRLRQQHPPDGLGRRLHERVRLPRLRAGLRAPAVLPRRRAVPLGRALAAIPKTSTRPTPR